MINIRKADYIMKIKDIIWTKNMIKNVIYIA